MLYFVQYCAGWIAYGEGKTGEGHRYAAGTRLAHRAGRNLIKYRR